jgi:hypothetical protein
MDIISRKEAKEKGLTRYFTGKPCKYGHISERLTSDGVCVACEREHRQENKEQLKEYYREWKQENRERLKEYKRKWYLENAQKEKERKRRWRQENADKKNATSAKRRAAKLQRTPAWANQEEITIWYEVAEVLSRSGVKFHVDHVVPLQGKIVSGLHVSENMQVLPASLNISKHNQWNWETQNHEQY